MEDVKQPEEIKKSEAVAEDVQNEPIKTKKRRKWPWIVGSLVLVFVVIPVLILGYLGFIPGLSSLMGATKPRDLGVRYSEADYLSYQTKTGGQFLDFANAPVNPLKPGKKTVFADPKYMDVALTQEEITATINMAGWSWMPATNVQVRLGDGTVEISGNLNMDQITNFVNFVGGVGYDQSSIDKALSWGKRLMNNPPVYVKAATSVKDNVLSMQIQSVQVGRFSAPMDIASTVFNTATENSLNNTYGLNIKSATFGEGQLNFVGYSPTTIYVKKD